MNLSKVNFIRSIQDKLPPPHANHFAIIERNPSGDLSNLNPIGLEAGANGCCF